MALVLRTYQTKAVDDVRAAFARHRSVLLQLPTGAGKTATASVIIRRAVSKHRRVVFAAHLDALVGDTLDRLRALGVYAGRVQAGEKSDPLAPVQVCSIQTLHARKCAPPADLIILDECHRAMAPSVRAVLDAYPRCPILGLSATPMRGDGAPLGDVFEVMVCGPSYSSLVALGVLVPCEVVAPPDVQDALAMAPKAAVERYAAGRPTVVFCRTVNEARELAASLPRAACIDGDTDIDQRRADLRRFNEGELDVITNCSVLSEGWDAPRAEVCVLARGVDHVGTFLQIVGRVLRASPGKTNALLVDLRGSVHKHGLPIDDRTWSLSGRASVRTSPLPLRTCPQCFGIFAPAPTCPRCAFVFPPPPPTPVREAEMSRVDSRSAEIRAAIRERGEAEMRRAWEQLVREGEERKYSPKWASMRFLKRFGLWPPASVTRGAA